MALQVTLVSPYIPPYPFGGGVAGGKAIFVNGNVVGIDGAHVGRFAVVDPAGSIRAFQITPPGGFSTDRCLNGASDGVSVWQAMSGTSSGTQQLWIARIWPDGSVDAHTSTFTMSVPWTINVESDEVWVFTQSTAVSPRRFTKSTLEWSATTTTATRATAEPVYHGGYVWAWNGNTLYRFDRTTMARTTVTTTGITGPRSQGQVVVHGGYAWWATSTAGRLVRISSSGEVSNVDTGTAFGFSLCVDSDGFLRSTALNGETQAAWHPTTGETWSESTGVTGGSTCYRNYAIGDVVIAGVWTT